MERNQPLPPDLIKRRNRFAQQRSLSQYAVSLPSQPQDISVVHPRDDRYTFFKKGRDFQSFKKQHQYTDEELRILETYESADILPSHTEVYREWANSIPSGSDFETWKIVCLIGILIGIIGFCIKETCEKLQIFSLPFINSYVESGEYTTLWIYYSIMSCTFASLSSIICTYYCPMAAGSGVPEIIGLLNGVVVRNVLSLKTLVCKIVSGCLTVLSGLPLGIEGPLVHIGAIISSLLSKPGNCGESCFTNHRNNKTKCQSSVDSESESEPAGFRMGCCAWLGIFRFRDCKERHNLICIGTAAGVASAFSAPIAGLLFAMEEMSSFWTNTLTWQTFVCAILARGITEILRGLATSLHRYILGEPFKIEMGESALFDMKENLNLNLLILVPCILIGVFGGIFGAFYILVLLKVARFRRKMLTHIKKTQILNVVKVIEPVFIALIVAAIIMSCMPFFECRNLYYTTRVATEGKYAKFSSFLCDTPRTQIINKENIIQKGNYNEAASLVFGSWEQMIRNLFSRKTPFYFGLESLGLVLGIFFIFSIWASQTCIVSGLLIPQLAIGALYGRMFGRALYGAFIPNENHHLNGNNSSTFIHNEEWDFLDPGALSLLGSASFLAGTARLPITSVVMLVEMTNDINMSLLIMAVVMISKFIGDLFTHPLYHSLLEFKCIPYLDSDLRIYNRGKRVNLELFKACDVMSSPVECVSVKESVQVLANLVLDNNHGGFPVVQRTNGFKKTFLGIITRLELTILLSKTEDPNLRDLKQEDMEKIKISYPDYSSYKLKNVESVNQILHQFVNNPKYADIYINLFPFINTSCCTVNLEFSLNRVYGLFRSLGLRHLVVVDHFYQVLGIITRKDLMGFSVDQKIKAILKKDRSRSESTPTPRQNQNPRPDPSDPSWRVTRMGSSTPQIQKQLSEIDEENDDNDESCESKQLNLSSSNSHKSSEDGARLV